MSYDDERVCVLEHQTDPARERRASYGYVCTGHWHGLLRDIERLAGFVEQADEASYDETVSVGLSAPTSGTKEKPLVYNDARANHKREVRERLANWCRRYATRWGHTPPEPTIADMGRWLNHYALWIVEDDEVADFHEAIGELGRRAWSLLNPSGIRRIEIGPCREPGCDGQLSALVRKTDDVLPSSISCSSCGVEITADQWLTYGRRVRTEEAA